MSGHPCRAHHKLKWARKLGRCPRASVQASLTLGEQQNNNRSKVPLTINASPPAQTPQGQPCLTGVGNNPLTVTKHGQRASSRMPKARRSRLSLTRRAGCATLPGHKQHTVAANSKIRPKRMALPSQHMSRRSRSEISTAMLASNPRLNPSKAPAEAFLSSAPSVGTQSSAQQRHILRPDAGSNVSARYKLRGALIKSAQQRPLVFNPCS